MSTVTATASDAVLISPTQLLALQAAEPVVLIDTRDADTYALGHIPGAGTCARPSPTSPPPRPKACRS